MVPGHRHKTIYHLVQTPLWEECKASGTTYYPPTYEADGFTHATADPSKLLEAPGRTRADRRGAARQQVPCTPPLCLRRHP